ncbi:hypothetical protein [Actinomyces massiliensis]|uniref:hypothetical protein n=1 Tax=Actinomyces massiliensis TaxID=461393 RepID=UPI0028E71812|nr:hypothetical protein [Actinomyces massiliensis]
MGAWIHWILTGLAPLCLSVAMWFALIQIRGLRERAETAERAVQQIADAIRYAADRAANSKEDTHE